MSIVTILIIVILVLLAIHPARRILQDISRRRIRPASSGKLGADGLPKLEAGSWRLAADSEVL